MFYLTDTVRLMRAENNDVSNRKRPLLAFKGLRRVFI